MKLMSPVWSTEESMFLLQVVDDLKAQGVKIKDLFPIAAQRVTEQFGIERTKDAVSFNYYQTKKKLKIAAEGTNTTEQPENQVPIEHEVRAGAIVEAAKEAKASKQEVAVASMDVIEFADNFISILEQSKSLILSLKRSNVEVGEENKRLKLELDRALKENKQLTDDNNHIMLVMNKARQIVVTEEMEAAGITVNTGAKFVQERNGNLATR